MDSVNANVVAARLLQDADFLRVQLLFLRIVTDVLRLGMHLAEWDGVTNSPSKDQTISRLWFQEKTGWKCADPVRYVLMITKPVGEDM